MYLIVEGDGVESVGDAEHCHRIQLTSHRGLYTYTHAYAHTHRYTYTNEVEARGKRIREKGRNKNRESKEIKRQRARELQHLDHCLLESQN
jgi:hypothetical protein